MVRAKLAVTLLWCVVIMLQYFSTASVAAGRRLRLLNYNRICTETPIVYLKHSLEFNSSACVAIKDYIYNVITCKKFHHIQM